MYILRLNRFGLQGDPYTYFGGSIVGPLRVYGAGDARYYVRIKARTTASLLRACLGSIEVYRPDEFSTMAGRHLTCPRVSNATSFPFLPCYLFI